MCSPTWETQNASDMCFPSWETHIPSDMCSSTLETHIPSDMCSPTWETHIPSDMCSPTKETDYVVHCTACDLSINDYLLSSFRDKLTSGMKRFIPHTSTRKSVR